jgi:uroporphyrinogen-III synthase
MRVLITRPEEDATELVAELAARGIDGTLSPLLTIEFIDKPALALAGVQALLMTSANGVRAFARNTPDRGLPVLAVGDATARAAEAAGFADVASAAGDVDDLAALAAERLDPAAGVLLHPAGSKVAGDLAGMLARLGFDYRRSVLYTARTATELPESARAGIAAGEFDGVLIYSPRTGATFKRLVQAAGLDAALATVRAYCLSANVAVAVAELPWAGIETAARPEQTALLALFGET